MACVTPRSTPSTRTRARGTTATINFRGRCLLNTIGKVFAPVILISFQKMAERVYKKCREQLQIPWYVALIFDLVSTEGQFKVLALNTDCSPKLQSMIDSFHADIMGEKCNLMTAPRTIRRRQRRQTRLRYCSNTILAFLCFAVEIYIRYSNRRNLPVYPIRWQAHQPGPSQSQDKGTRGSHQGHAVC